MRISLKTWVQKELIPKHIAEGIITEPPSALNRAYYPTNEDIRVIAQSSIIQERKGRFDQEAVHGLLENEKKVAGLEYYFRCYKMNDRHVDHINSGLSRGQLKYSAFVYTYTGQLWLPNPHHT